MKWYCIHDWPKWGEPKDTHTSFNKRQFRYCKKCNALAYRTIRINDAMSAANMKEVSHEV